RGRRNHHHDVDIQSNHLGRKFLETLSLTLCIPTFNDQVAALLVAVFPEALEQGVVKAFMSVRDKSHPPNFAWLLRPRRERPGCGQTTEKPDELEPSHGAPKA